MKNNKSYFVTYFLIGFVLIILIGAGIYTYLHNSAFANASVKQNELTTDSLSDTSLSTNNTASVSLAKNKDSSSNRRLIRVSLGAIAGTFRAESEAFVSKNGSYDGICDNAKPFFTGQVHDELSNLDPLELKIFNILGLKESSYKINQLVCQSAPSYFVLTIPITLEDGTQTHICVDSKGNNVTGNSNPDTHSCTKQTVTPSQSLPDNATSEVQLKNIFRAYIRSEAEVVYSKGPDSYQLLCKSGFLNKGVTPGLDAIIKDILKAKKVSTQSAAGIKCLSQKEKYAVAIAGVNGTGWCVDNLGRFANVSIDTQNMKCADR